MMFLKGCITLILVCLGIVAIFFPLAVFVHEGTHSLLFTLEGVPVTSFHVLDSESLQNGRLGFVTTMHTSHYDAIFHEVVATITASLFMASVLLFILLVSFRELTVHHLESMGLKRNPSGFMLQNS